MSSEDIAAGKALIASKTFWLAIIEILVFVIASPAITNNFPWVAVYSGVLIGVLAIVVRKITDTPVTGIVSA
jgi:hypothetical protein